MLLAVLLAANRGVGRGILESFIWQPVACRRSSPRSCHGGRRLPLSALFRYMRKLTRANPAIKDPRVDVSAVYAALALLAAGVANQRGPEFYIAVVAGTACLLFARARQREPRGGALMLCAAAAWATPGTLACRSCSWSCSTGYWT